MIKCCLIYSLNSISCKTGGVYYQDLQRRAGPASVNSSAAGEPVGQVAAQLRRDFAPTLALEWVMWAPLDVANFADLEVKRETQARWRRIRMQMKMHMLSGGDDEDKVKAALLQEQQARERERQMLEEKRLRVEAERCAACLHDGIRIQFEDTHEIHHSPDGNTQ